MNITDSVDKRYIPFFNPAVRASPFTTDPQAVRIDAAQNLSEDEKIPRCAALRGGADGSSGELKRRGGRWSFQREEEEEECRGKRKKI